MSDPNPYEAPSAAIRDAEPPPGKLQLWHGPAWVCLVLAIPYYFILAAASAWEVVSHSDGHQRLAYGMWFASSIGSLLICLLAFRKVDRAQPYALLFTVCGLALAPFSYFGGFVFHRLARLIVG